jgi:COP9 signalosome complex subunit 4
MLLEEEDSVTAETFFNRATLIVHSVKDPELLLHFKVSQARMFDYNRKFAEAASKYHEISYIPLIEETERIQTL